jgi:signal transduction histidine kinase
MRLAREIISAMGGKLTSTHTPGQERTVIITLPAAIRSRTGG